MDSRQAGRSGVLSMTNQTISFRISTAFTANTKLVSETTAHVGSSETDAS